MTTLAVITWSPSRGKKKRKTEEKAKGNREFSIAIAFAPSLRLLPA